MINNKYGFTLVELLGVFLVIAIVMGLVITSYVSSSKNREKIYYKGLENSLFVSANEYNDYNKLVVLVGDSAIIKVRELINNKYISNLNDFHGNSCDLDKSNVKIFKNYKDKNDLVVCLVCDNYVSDYKECSDN